MDASSDSAYRALAAKIDSLGQLCARLARENAALHDQVSRLGAVASAASAATTASAVERQPAPAALQPGPAAGPAQPAGGQANVLEGRVTRRLAGRTLGVAAAGLMGAVALTELGARPGCGSARSQVPGPTGTTSPDRRQHGGCPAPTAAYRRRGREPAAPAARRTPARRRGGHFGRYLSATVRV
jgi:hypothetical protein